MSTMVAEPYVNHVPTVFSSFPTNVKRREKLML
jgi:hypothetical protein